MFLIDFNTLVNAFDRQRCLAMSLTPSLAIWKDSADMVAGLLVDRYSYAVTYPFGSNDLYAVYLAAHPAVTLTEAIKYLVYPEEFNTQDALIYEANRLHGIANTYYPVRFQNELLKKTYAEIFDVPIELDASIVKTKNGVIYKKNSSATAWEETNSESTIATASDNTLQDQLCVDNGAASFALASAATPELASGMLAIAQQNLSIGQSGNYLLSGKHPMSGLTEGALYYVASTPGAITTTRPETGTPRVCGYALSNSVLFFNPSLNLIIPTSAVPLHFDSVGVFGQIAIGDDYIDFCVAINKWIRIAGTKNF